MLRGAAQSRLRLGSVRVLRVHARCARTGTTTRRVRPADHVRHRRRDATSPSTRSTTSRATASPVRCASATARSTSASTTCGGCSSTRSDPHPRAAVRSARTCGPALPTSSTTRSNASPEPDQGIWEMRGEPQHFVASKVMCWVASDRGIRSRATAAITSEPTVGQTAAERIHAEICEKGLDPARPVFVQHYEHDVLDASASAHPDHGVPPADDERVRRPCSRSPTSSPRTASSCATGLDHADDGLRGDPRARSRSAPSGSSPRSRSSARRSGRGPVREAAFVRRSLAFVRGRDRCADRPAPRELPAGVHAPRADRRRAAAHRVRGC